MTILLFYVTMFVLNAKSCTILGTNFGRISRFLLGWKTFTPF